MCQAGISIGWSMCVFYLRFGYVDFGSPEEGQKAIELDGSEIDGRTVRINMAEARRTPAGGGRGRGGGRGGGSRGRGKSTPSSTLICIGLSYNTDNDSLSGAFPDCVSARIITDRDTGKPRGYVRFYWHNYTVKSLVASTSHKRLVSQKFPSQVTILATSCNRSSLVIKWLRPLLEVIVWNFLLLFTSRSEHLVDNFLA